MLFITVDKTSPGLEIICDIDLRVFEIPWSIAQWRSEVENSSNRTLLISVDEAMLCPAGFITYGISGKDIELKKIAILPEYRRKYAASSAMNMMIESARKDGMDNIVVEVAITNSSAIRLYNSFEFKVIHIRKKYYNNLIDALVMQKKLA